MMLLLREKMALLELSMTKCFMLKGSLSIEQITVEENNPFKIARVSKVYTILTLVRPYVSLESIET
jgi:hypothetical protein